MPSDDYLHLLRSSTQHLAAHDRLFQIYHTTMTGCFTSDSKCNSVPVSDESDPLSSVPGKVMESPLVVPTVLLVNNLGRRCIPGDTALEAPGVAPNKTPSVLDKSVKHLTFLFSLSCTSAGNKPDDHRGLLIRC